MYIERNSNVLVCIIHRIQPLRTTPNKTLSTYLKRMVFLVIFYSWLVYSQKMESLLAFQISEIDKENINIIKILWRIQGDMMKTSFCWWAWERKLKKLLLIEMPKPQEVFTQEQWRWENKCTPWWKRIKGENQAVSKVHF